MCLNTIFRCLVYCTVIYQIKHQSNILYYKWIIKLRLLVMCIKKLSRLIECYYQIFIVIKLTWLSIEYLKFLCLVPANKNNLIFYSQYCCTSTGSVTSSVLSVETINVNVSIAIFSGNNYYTELIQRCQSIVYK